ncbi:MAG: glutamine amidotransferase, partial [Planctomycetes bacterium]|nr:glutamine amidotransferase [Planctomycetota bacterium]
VFALALRTLVLMLLVFALGEMQYQRTSDRLTVIYLLDQSLSIPEARREAMIRYTNASIREQRNDSLGDQAGVIVFGRNAEVELPPVDFDIQLRTRIESLLDPEFTNLANAMQRAMAMFPHDSAKRVVIVTDGNENIGDALEQARAMADAGVSIDVLPVPLVRTSEVSVDKVALPADVRRGQPFELRVVLNNATEETENVQPVAGKIRIIRKAGDREETLADAPVEIEPGKRVFSLREEIDQADFYTYEARFVPDDPKADALSQNNLATAFTHVRGKGQVLLIEDWEHAGEFDYLIERLRDDGLEVVAMPSNRLFSSLPELQRYDTVILANVPRSSGEDAASVSSFTDEQIKMLVRNTEELGCGLIMVGGPNSFGAGGWTNTDLEKAMPVDFQIKSAKVVPVGALVLNMHAGEIPQANYWQKVIAEEAIKALGPRDYCGLISWNGTDQWLWGQSQGGMLRVGPNRQVMLSRIDRMSIGDMPEFDPSMKKAAAAFAALPDAAVKHMIIISDGDPSPPSPSTLQALKDGGVKVTTVAVGSHGILGSNIMQDIATFTGGKYYVVNNANALPKIYQREARRIARPLVYEPQPPVIPQILMDHEIVQGLNDAFPPVSGFVLTSVKENSLVEVILRSPIPSEAQNSTILAAWNYGLGKAVAFTTDAGLRWTSSWTAWDQYDRFFSQMVRWSMRPSGDTGNFVVTADVQGSKTQVVISALDKNDEFLNYQTMTGTVIGPNMESIPLDIEQTAPGRYVGEFDSTTPGSYMIMVTPGAGQAMIRTGVNVGYSDEFRDRESNVTLLESIAKLLTKAGDPGKLLPPLPEVPETKEEESLGPQLAVDPYRHDLPLAIAIQDIWPWLVLVGSCLFFADVFVRRVQVSFDWLGPVWTRAGDIVLRREREVVAPETMERLRSRKAEIERSIESRRAASRFEPDAETPIDPNATEIQATAAEPTKLPAASPQMPKVEDEPEDSYTARLLKAKKQVWKDRGIDDNK